MATEAYGSGVPRQINKLQPARQTSQPVPTGLHLALVGEFPTLDPARVYSVSTPTGLRALGPKDYHLGLVGELVFSPAINEPLATSKPASVKLVNALSSTAAAVTSVDADAANSLVFTSVKFGPVGNRSSATVSAATNKSATGGKKYVFASGDGVSETWDDVGYGNVLTVNYSGTAATTMTLAYASDSVRVSYTKTSIAVGTYTPGAEMKFDGTITITPSAAPTGGAYTALVTGTAQDGSAQSQTLTWPDSGGSAAQTTSGSYATVSSIVFGNTAGGSPTFTIAGYAYDLSVADCPKVSDVVELIGGHAYFTATGGVNATTLGTDKLDDFAAFTCKGADCSLTANVQAAIDKLAASAVYVVTRATGAGGKAPAVGTYIPTGGSTGSVSASTYETRLGLLLNKKVDILWADSADSAVHAKVLDHLNTCLSAGGKARLAHLGTASSSSLSTVTDAIDDLNSYAVGSFWCQDITRADQTGAAVTLEPKYLALVAAAVQCAMAIGEPMTHKRLTCTSYTQAATIDVDNNQNVLISLGLSFVAVVDGTIQFVRPLTTYRVGDNSYLDEPGSVLSYFASINDIHDEFARVRAIGSANTRLTAKDAESICLSRLNKQKLAKTIKNFAPDSVLATPVGSDWYRIAFDVQPVSGINFLETQPALVTVQA